MSTPRTSWKSHVIRFFSSSLVALIMSGQSQAAAPTVSSNTVLVEHVTVSSDKPYGEVKRNLEERLGRLDDNIRTLLHEGNKEELHAALLKAAGTDGLVIHYVGVHGDWLILKGGPKNVTEYFIGNILSAVEMTSVNFAAGLYAPLRIVLYENAEGGSTIEYDRPSTQLSQFRSARIDLVGKSLDERILKLAFSAEQ